MQNPSERILKLIRSPSERILSLIRGISPDDFVGSLVLNPQPLKPLNSKVKIENSQISSA